MYKSIFIVVIIYLLSGCTQQTAERARIVANDYSDATFKNGIVTTSSKGYSFYFLADSSTANLVKVGDRLIFSKSGEAVVSKIDVVDQTGKMAVFVLVDKKLDPAGDGYPNPIIVR